MTVNQQLKRDERGRAVVGCVSLLLLAAMIAPVRAQVSDDDDDEEEVAAAVPRQGMVHLGIANFDQWVFQNNGNAFGARKRLDSLLAVQIDDVDRACKLTEAQRKKLHLSGRGDIKHFFDRYDEVKRKFERFNNNGQFPQDIWQELWREINPLQAMLHSGLSNDSSILSKSLHHCLTNEQLGRYESILRERREFEHRANIELVVAMLEQGGVPFRDQQRRDFIALLLSLTKAPRRTVQNRYQVILLRISRLPEEKLKPLCDDFQWKALRRQMSQAKQMEPWLRQSGQLADDDEEAKK